jgi:hypothetical protein
MKQLMPGRYFLRLYARAQGDGYHYENGLEGLYGENGLTASTPMTINLASGDSLTGLDSQVSAVFVSARSNQDELIPSTFSVSTEMWPDSMTVFARSTSAEQVPLLLPPGNHRIRAAPVPPSPFLSEWWQDAATPEQADVVVTKGLELIDVEFVLDLGASITGRILAASGAPLSGRFSLTAHDTSGAVVATANTNGVGEYVLTGLPEGSYTVQVPDPRSPFAPTWYPNRRDSTSATSLSVVPPERLEGIDVVLQER